MPQFAANFKATLEAAVEAHDATNDQHGQDPDGSAGALASSAAVEQAEPAEPAEHEAALPSVWTVGRSDSAAIVRRCVPNPGDSDGGSDGAPQRVLQTFSALAEATEPVLAGAQQPPRVPRPPWAKRSPKRTQGRKKGARSADNVLGDDDFPRDNDPGDDVSDDGEDGDDLSWRVPYMFPRPGKPLLVNVGGRAAKEGWVNVNIEPLAGLDLDERRAAQRKAAQQRESGGGDGGGGGGSGGGEGSGEGVRHVDVVAAMDDLWAFPESSVTAVYASHILEHASYQRPSGAPSGGDEAGGGGRACDALAAAGATAAEAQSCAAERRRRLGIFAEGEVAAALEEWHRVLLPGGALFVAVSGCWRRRARAGFTACFPGRRRRRGALSCIFTRVSGFCT